MATKKRKDILFEFQHKRKAELEAWLVMEARLDEVIEALETLPEMLTWSPNTRASPPLPTGHSIRVRSLYCFAAVTYIRCFATGRRSGLDISQVPNVTAKDLVLHESIRLMSFVGWIKAQRAVSTIQIGGYALRALSTLRRFGVRRHVAA